MAPDTGEAVGSDSGGDDWKKDGKHLARDGQSPDELLV